MKLWVLITAIQLAAILIHEAGHVLAAWVFHFRFLGIGFNLLGPYVRVFGNYSQPENTIVALAGPGANCVAGAILAAAGLPATGRLVALVGLVNMLPIPGSDCWRAMRAVQGKWQKLRIERVLCVPNRPLPGACRLLPPTCAAATF
jgi:hypothetical protein